MTVHKRGTWTLFKRECLRIIYAWQSAVIPPLVTNTLYILVFGTIVGSRMERIQGFAYLDFILPGLIGLVAITQAFNASSFSVFHARWDDYVREVLTAPLYYWEMLLAYIGGSLFHGLTTGTLLVCIAWAFTDVTFAHLGTFIIFIILSCILFGCLGIITGLAASEFGHINMASNFIIMPLVFLGGVFFTLEMIPAAWEWIILANPLLYVVNGLRHGMIGFTDIAISHAVTVLTICCAAMVVFTLYLMRKGFGIRH